MARAVIERSHAGDRVLVYRAQEARDVLPRMLEEAGLVATVVPAYKTVVPNDPEFAAESGARRRADLYEREHRSRLRRVARRRTPPPRDSRRNKCVACIGPITARAAAETGLHVDVVASRYTTAGLLDALEAHFVARSVTQSYARRRSSLRSSRARLSRARTLRRRRGRRFCGRRDRFRQRRLARPRRCSLRSFIPSTLLSRFGATRKRALAQTTSEISAQRLASARKRRRRGLCALLAARGGAPFAAAFAGAFAAASADTWGTEIGTLSRRAPVSILTLRTLRAGRLRRRYAARTWPRRWPARSALRASQRSSASRRLRRVAPAASRARFSIRSSARAFRRCDGVRRARANARRDASTAAAPRCCGAA